MIKQMDGLREGRCLDTDSESLQPGGATRVYPCFNRWYQFLSFGDGRLAPRGSIFSTIPSQMVRQIHNLGHEQIPYMCLGVLGRGDQDEVHWDEGEDEGGELTVAAGPGSRNESFKAGEWEPLSEWMEQELVTTQCTNVGAVIEWLFVPFIVEEDSPGSSEEEPNKSADKEVTSRINESLPTTTDECDDSSRDKCQIDNNEEL